MANPTNVSTNMSDNFSNTNIDNSNYTEASSNPISEPITSVENNIDEAPSKNNGISYGVDINSGIDNQSVNKSNSGSGGTIVVILMVVIVGIVCAAYFVIKRRRKTGEERLNDEDIESYSVPFNTTLTRQGSEDNSKYSRKGNQVEYSISLNEDNNSLNHPLPTIPNQNEVQEYNSLSRKQIKAENNAVESITTREAHYGNNDSSQYVIDSIASTQYPPQYTVTAQYQHTDQYSTDQNHAEITHNSSLSQNQVDNSQYTTTSQSPQANQYVNESIDNQVTSNSSKYVFDDQDDDTASSSSSPRYGYDTMDHQTLSQSSKYLYDSIDRNMSLTSRSIFDSMENLKLSQSSKNLLESKNINLSQSIFDSLDNQSSQNHVFDPNNSSIDIYATEAVISLSDDVMEAVDVKYTRNH
jgi:hypothetical protein